MPLRPRPSIRTSRHWLRLAAAAAAAWLILAGCATLDEKQRQWIFQPNGGATQTSPGTRVDGMEEVWIEYRAGDEAQVRLHGLWLAQDRADAPVLLYLHGARRDVRGNSWRMRRMHELGFAVLAVDYRGFGLSAQALPSEASAAEDARAAWTWLATQYPSAKRFIFGHSLGGAIAVHLAADVADEAGVIVEGTFTSIADVVSTYRWGWLPVGPLITQRFDSAARVRQVGSPLLVVHGSEDKVIRPELGRALYEQASTPKRFVLVPGGSHHNTNALGQQAYRDALRELFGLGRGGRAAGT